MSHAELEKKSYKGTDINAAIKEGNMVIKVQVPIRLLPGQPNQIMMYNKTRSFQAYCDGNVGTGRELSILIKTRGLQGAKGYFLGFIEREGELTLLIDRMLPAQPW